MRQLCHAVLVALSLFTTAAALSACNTMAGAGEDLQQGGKNLTNSAVHNGAEPVN